MITIDKNIPMPEPPKNQIQWMQLLPKMEVGDSFLIPAEMVTSSVRTNSYMYAKRLGIRLSVRKVEEDGSIRVWRME